MNKKLGLALLAAVLCIPFTAQADNGYIGFNAGRAGQKLNADEEGSLKANSTGYKLYGGYEFNQYFGVQGGYIDMGKAKEAYAFDDVTGNGSSKVKSLYIAATASLPVNDQFSIFGKLGVSRNRVRLSDNWLQSGIAHYESVSVTRTKRLVGIGAAYKFTKNLTAVAEYEDFGRLVKGEGADLKARMLSIGVRYHF